MALSVSPLSHSGFTAPPAPDAFTRLCRRAPDCEEKAPAPLMEVVLPRNSFWVLMSPKSRGPNSWLRGSSLLCSVLALRGGRRTDPKKPAEPSLWHRGKDHQDQAVSTGKMSFILFKRRMSCNEILQLP